MSSEIKIFFPQGEFKFIRGKRGDRRMAKGTQKRGRSAKDGRFIPVKQAEKDKEHSVVETIKKKK